VDSSGAVVARGVGTTSIGAAVREHFATAHITVLQQVRAVAIAHDTLLRIPEGTSVTLVARPLDARGRFVPGRPIKWTTGDSTVVAINAAGVAQAMGPGHAILTAQADGYTSTITADVTLTPTSVALVSGAGQRAPAGRRLAQPVQLQVNSRGGRPMADVPVTFTTEGDEGSADPAKTVTDRNGRAHAMWTLGAHAGRQRLVIAAAGVDSAVTVIAEADPVPANTRIKSAREVPAGRAGAALAEPVGVRVTDSTGAAEADVPVSWTALDGGTIEALAARTDSVGEAWARWTLGPHAGTQHARVQVGNARAVPAFTLTANALAETPAGASIVSGSGQEARVGAALKQPVVVVLKDRNGNPVAGAAIRVMAREGAVADTMPVADDKGRVRIQWTLGTKSGDQQLDLAAGAGAPLAVHAKALPLAPANIELGALPASAPAAHALAKAVVATVTDAYGNVVSDVQVVFNATGGSPNPSRVMTDAKGQAATHWTLGSAAGDETITAVVKGTGVSAFGTVHVTKGSKK
jgi:5-hydroxyisourate hydrolase-like protein (transthyretin family)